MLISQTDEIKSKLSVEEVISGYLQLQRAGRNLKANCPFHNEKTPSFMVSPERQMWHCFGCDEGGDIFSFVMKIEGLEFRDALKLLAEKAGVELKSTGYKSGDAGKKKRILEVVEVSRKFYEECLKIKTGKKAFEYLSERGLSKNIIEKFQLGYAPDSWDLLSKFLQKKGYQENEIFSAGMTVKKDRGGHYDRFRGRIMFPINNVSEQTVGFSSRVMPGQDESQAKYINTPETALYNKSQILYGLDKAKLAIRKNDLAILVEGNMDVIASFQAEVENVIAASGTALTAEQIRIIKRYTDNIAFSFDLDSAGIKAANRGIEIALAEGMSVQVITVPEGKDPADCVKSNPDLWREAVKNPKQIMEFYFESIFAKYDLTKIEDKKKIAAELLNIITKISNKIEQSHYLQMLAERLSIDEKVLVETLENAKRDKPRFENKFKKSKDDPKALNAANRENQLQEKLLGLVILNPQIFEEIYTGLDGLFLDQKLNTIYNLIKKLYLKNKKINTEDLEELKKELSTEKYSENGQNELLYLWNTAALRVEAELEVINNIFEEASVCVLNLKKIKLHKDLKKLETDIKNAERANDLESQKLLMGEFDKCVKELGELEG